MFSKLSKIKLSVLIFSFSVLCLTLAFFLSGLTWKQIVNAFTTKSAGSTLTVNDWNGLLGDFVKKSGDTMTGSLTISNGSLNINNGNINVSGKITAARGLINGNLQVNGNVNAGAGNFVNAGKLCINGSCKSSWPKSNFGGAYWKQNGTCMKSNPYTNSCNCPAGYTSRQQFSIWISGCRPCESFYCYKP